MLAAIIAASGVSCIGAHYPVRNENGISLETELCVTSPPYLYRSVVSNFTQRFYIVGVANDESKYRLLKIDRTNPTELTITDDKVCALTSLILTFLRITI